MEFHSTTSDTFVYDATYTLLDDSLAYNVQPTRDKRHTTRITRDAEVQGEVELHTLRSDVVVLHGKPLEVKIEKKLLCSFCTFQAPNGVTYRWSATTLEAELKDCENDSVVVATWKRGSKPAFDLTSNRPSVLHIFQSDLTLEVVDEIFTTGIYAMQKERARIGHAGAFMGGISGLGVLSPAA